MKYDRQRNPQYEVQQIRRENPEQYVQNQQGD